MKIQIVEDGDLVYSRVIMKGDHMNINIQVRGKKNTIIFDMTSVIGDMGDVRNLFKQVFYIIESAYMVDKETTAE
jgi:hypothetical protein